MDDIKILKGALFLLIGCALIQGYYDTILLFIFGCLFILMGVESVIGD